MRYTVTLLLVATLAGCSSSGSSRPASMPQPIIEVRQLGPIFFGSGTTAPVSLEILITNRGDAVLTLRRALVETPTMTQFGFQASRIFNQSIQPRSTRTFSLQGTARASRSRLDPSEPLTVRAVVDFETEGRHFRDVSIQNPATGYR